MNSKIIIEYDDHLAICVSYYGVLFLEDCQGKLCYSSKFKLKEKTNRIIKKLGIGSFTIKYKDCIFLLKISEVGCPVGIDTETMVHKSVLLSYDSKDKELLEEFFSAASKYYIDNVLDKSKEENKTTIYIWDDFWETMEKRRKRELATVYLGGKEIEIYNKINNFLSEDTMKLYTKLGMPYKYNILFHGHPGTGKTSLIYSLASELNMDVALIHFTKDMTDIEFMRSMRRVPSNTIVVLEDIDVLFEVRKKNDEFKCGISFSGLLNSLDGIAHVDKQIIVMTTNCKMVLDKALTRPGRIDLDVEFKYSTKKQIKTMFEKFIPNQSSKFGDFYKKIKNLNLTTAILQQYLFSNIYCEDILETTEELVELCQNNNYEYKKDTLYT